MDDYQLAANLVEHANGRRSTTDRGATAPFARNRPTQKQPCITRTGNRIQVAAGIANAIGDRPLGWHQPQSFDDRLARAPTAGSRSHRVRRAATPEP